MITKIHMVEGDLNPTRIYFLSTTNIKINCRQYLLWSLYEEKHSLKLMKYQIFDLFNESYFDRKK